MIFTSASARASSVAGLNVCEALRHLYCSTVETNLESQCPQSSERFYLSDFTHIIKRFREHSGKKQPICMNSSTTDVCVSGSDEELEDYKALLYLPIAPEVEDPEENPFGPPPDASGQAATTEDASAGGDKKQRQPSSEGGPAKKKARTTTIELQGVPSDGEWSTSTDAPARSGIRADRFVLCAEPQMAPVINLNLCHPVFFFRGAPPAGRERRRQVQEEDCRPAQGLQR